MTSSLFTSSAKRLLSTLLSVSLSVTSALPSFAQAQSVSCDGWTANSGADSRCGAVVIGGVPVPYPKLQWDFVSDMPVTATPGSSVVQGGSAAVELANRAALSLGLSASDVANTASVFPSNVPYIFARYNPASAELQVDIFKLEKTANAGVVKAGLYHTTFGPGHGDFWKANRSYLSPDSYKAGVTPGVNPFVAFKAPGSDTFHNISLSAAEVAIGHAMRLAGAPLALVSLADTRLSSETHTSSGLFTKKTDTYVFGHAKSKWLIAQPADILNRTSTQAFAAFCAADPSRATCERFATAVSGVGFEEFEGGTLSAIEDRWQIDHQSSSGLSFLGALVLAVVGSFALAGVMAAAGVGGMAAAGATAAGTTGGVTMGTFGSFLVNQSFITGFSSLGTALAAEAAYVATSMALIGGANLGSVIDANPGVLLGQVSVSKGLSIPGQMNRYTQLINNQVAPRMLNTLGTANSALTSQAQLLTGFGQTVLGDCLPNARLRDCAGATGVIPRVDQFQEQSLVNFTRDNHGSLLKNDAPASNGGVAPYIPPVQNHD